MKFIEKRGDEFVFEIRRREVPGITNGILRYRESLDRDPSREKMNEDEKDRGISLGTFDNLYAKKMPVLDDMLEQTYNQHPYDENETMVFSFTLDELCLMLGDIIFYCMIECGDEAGVVIGTDFEDLVQMTAEMIQVMDENIPRDQKIESDRSKRNIFKSNVESRKKLL